MVTDQAFGIAVQLVGTDGMHATDQRRAIAAGTHGMSQGRDCRIENMVVGPHAVLMRIPSRQGRHARRHTDRRRTVAGIEDDAGSGQLIKMRRLHQRVAIGTNNGGTVLIGVQVEQIGSVGHDGPLFRSARVGRGNRSRQDRFPPRQELFLARCADRGFIAPFPSSSSAERAYVWAGQYLSMIGRERRPA